MALSAADLVVITGQHGLFLGIETYNWTLDQFKQAAQFAKVHDTDCLLIKVHDGANRWYGNIGSWQLIKEAVQEQGVGAIPYGYSYGNTFGALDAEIDLMIEYLQDSGVFCADMEQEWDGDVASAQHLCSRMLPEPGTFLVSTWADPSLHNWQGVIAALAPCTTVFMPQQYNNYLATFWAEFGANGAVWLQPTVDLSGEFGDNDPVAIASNAYNQGHTAISVWNYEVAVQNPGLLDQVYAAFPKQGGTQQMQTYGPNSADFNAYFTANADGSWTCKQHNTVLLGGNLALYQRLSMDGQSLPIAGLPLENEQYHTEPDGYAWSSQQCERATIVYDPAHRKDNQPGLGDCYLAHVNPPMTITQIPDALKTDLNALPSALEHLVTKLFQDAGLPTP